MIFKKLDNSCKVAIYNDMYVVYNMMADENSALDTILEKGLTGEIEREFNLIYLSLTGFETLLVSRDESSFKSFEDTNSCSQMWSQ